MTLTISPVLRAQYTALSDACAAEHKIEVPTSGTNAESKATYLSNLRSATVTLQGQVNDFLTQKMEEDKAGALANGKGTDDKQEEEKYGEEVVEDEP